MFQLHLARHTLEVKSALEWRSRGLLDVKLALERRAWRSLNGSRPWNTKHIRHRNDGMACERRVTKMNPEIDSKSCWVGSRGLQNRVKIGPGTPSGLPTAPKSIPRASWERLGSGSGRPRRVPGAPGGSPRAPRDAQKDAEERPRSHRDSENRRPSTSRSGKIRCRLRDPVCEASLEHGFGDFRRFSVFLESLRTL